MRQRQPCASPASQMSIDLSAMRGSRQLPGYSRLVGRIHGLKQVTILSTICGAGVVLTGSLSPSLVSASGFAFPVLGAGFSILVVSYGLMFVAASKARELYLLSERNLAVAFDLMDASALQKAMEGLELTANADRLFAQRLEMDHPRLQTRLTLLKNAETKKCREKEVRSCFSELRTRVIERIGSLRDGSPVLHARQLMIRGLQQAIERRARLERDVEAHLRKLSWWNRLNFDEPDFRAMDREIKKLERQVSTFLRTNALKIEAAETRLQLLQERAETRLDGAERAALTSVPEDHRGDVVCDNPSRAFTSRRRSSKRTRVIAEPKPEGMPTFLLMKCG